MPREMSAGAIAKVAQQYGHEPIVILEIEWVPGGQRFIYADRDVGTVDEGVKGRIQELSGLDAIVQVSNGADSQEISVKLRDHDFEVKTIMDTNDVHKRPCWVYQWFEGLDLSDKFLIFKGDISSPIVWNEGDRTVSFSVITKIEDAEVGFSIDEGNFYSPPEDLVGKPWPLCFGTCINVPALKAKSILEGTLARGVGIKDPTLAARLSVAEVLVCPWAQDGYVSVPSGGVISVPVTVPRFCWDEGCRKAKCELKESLALQLEEQEALEFDTFTVYGGENFPQNKKITLDINGGKFRGIMSGETFTVTSRRHPDVAANGDLQDEDGRGRREIQSRCPGINDPTQPRWTNIHQIQLARQNLRFAMPDGLGGVNFTSVLATLEIESNATDQGGCFPVIPPGLAELERSKNTSELSRVTHNYQSSIPSLSFFWANPGSKVTLDSFKETIYIANILPSTIHRVAAVRNVEGLGDRLLTVPTSFYTSRVVDYNGYMVTEVVMDRPLSSRNKGWTDDVYITLTSSVGPNTVDIIEWIIETYTDYDIDSTSFDYVRTAIDNYPSHFPLLDRRNLIDLLQDIAFQARCALWLKNDTFYIKYLAEEPTADDTMTVSDFEQNSLEIFHTETEDLVTKYTVEWQEDYYLQDPNKVILRHNVKKYGTHEETRNFFIYNIYQLVVKSATFWLIRKANTWRKIKFRTALNKLKLENLDCAEITYTHLGDGPIKCICEKASFDSDNKRLEFEFWTPIKSGTRVPYDFAFPADVDENAIWPTEDETTRGFAGSGRLPNFSVIAPADHPLNREQESLVSVGGDLRCADGSESTLEKGCRADHGDKKPSDTGDTKPEPKVKTGEDADLDTDPTDPFKGWVQNQFAQFDSSKGGSDKVAQQTNQNQQDDGGVNEGEDEDLPRTCEGNCTVGVRKKYGIPSLIHHLPSETPYFDATPGAQGVIVFIDETRTECHLFNSLTQAIAYRDAAQAEINALSNYNYTVGQEDLWQTSLTATNLGLDTDEFLEDGETPNPNYNQPCDEPALEDFEKVGFTETFVDEDE